MSLVQVQRSPSPSVEDESERLELHDSRCSSRNRSMSECYFAVRGAAVILPHRFSDWTNCSGHGVGIEEHLQLMLRLIRPQDQCRMTVALQTHVTNHSRYLNVVSTRDDNDERVLLVGLDFYNDNMTVGVVVPLLWCSKVELASDGGVVVHGSSRIANSADNLFIFKPVSVQAMWVVFQSLHRELEIAQLPAKYDVKRKEPGIACQYYMDKISSPPFLCAYWNQSPFDEEYDFKADSLRDVCISEDVKIQETLIRKELKHIMQSVDLDFVTSKDIRDRLAHRVANIDAQKEFVDREMLVILGQMEHASRIFDYLLLGTEWNACNWDELQANNVGFILNMTREVDNFYPHDFQYIKIPVTDEANTQLIQHWNSTSAFIKLAKSSGKVCLVHCKKGISRSSSTVIAYAMKEYGWSLEKALAYVKQRRNCITPNKGFMEQLGMFAGALEASRFRHAPQFNATKSGSRPRRAHSVCRVSPCPSDSVNLIIRKFETGHVPKAHRATYPCAEIIKRSSIQQMS